MMYAPEPPSVSALCLRPWGARRFRCLGFAIWALGWGVPGLRSTLSERHGIERHQGLAIIEEVDTPGSVSISKRAQQGVVFWHHMFQHHRCANACTDIHTHIHAHIHIHMYVYMHVCRANSSAGSMLALPAPRLLRRGIRNPRWTGLLSRNLC